MADDVDGAEQAAGARRDGPQEFAVPSGGSEVTNLNGSFQSEGSVFSFRSGDCEQSRSLAALMSSRQRAHPRALQQFSPMEQFVEIQFGESQVPTDDVDNEFTRTELKNHVGPQIAYRQMEIPLKTLLMEVVHSLSH
ncbi:unnamed protein product [Urochloa humidicola]